MSLNETRLALGSEVRNVVVVAPAGCGKTYEASRYALDAAQNLDVGQTVLFLAHTNAAVREFRDRTVSSARKIKASTIDAFCLEMLSPYASRLHLPCPLHQNVGKGAGFVPFPDLAHFVVDLLKRSPSIAGMYSRRHPVMILDEHQDANLFQHEAIQLIAKAGPARVRIFGDPMQAIYAHNTQQLISWNAVEGIADIRTSLDSPERWKEVPMLGDWILALRARLKAGQSMPDLGLDTPVALHRTDNEDFGFRPLIDRQTLVLLQNVMSSLDGTIAVLGWLNPQVFKLQVATRGRLVLNEGADFEEAYKTLENLDRSKGKPRALAKAVIAAFSKPSCGLTAARKDRIEDALGKSQIEVVKSKELGSLIRQLQPIYDSPDLSTACQVIQAIAKSPPPWLSIRTPACFSVLGRLRPTPDSNPKDQLRQPVMFHKQRARRPRAMASTIHKSKGLEFDHVILTNFGAIHFSGDEQSRFRAYVALSRAKRSIHIVIPNRTPSPLLISPHF